MDVGRYSNNGTMERDEFLSAKAVGKKANGKILGVRSVKTPKFEGLFLTVKVNGKKYAYALAFNRFDVGAVCQTLGSSETDDWIGESITFVTKAGKTRNGKKAMFVNVLRPKTSKKIKSKKAKSKRRR